MSKYLLHGSYTEEGLKGILKDGGTKLLPPVRKYPELAGFKIPK